VLRQHEPYEREVFVLMQEAGVVVNGDAGGFRPRGRGRQVAPGDVQAGPDGRDGPDVGVEAGLSSVVFPKPAGADTSVSR
jgi:hypothetical protein